MLRDFSNDNHVQYFCYLTAAQTTMGTLVTTSVRKAIPGCEVCILNAGGIRGNKKYDKQAFTYADLKTEIPFENPVTLIELPGQVIADAVQYSRQGSYSIENIVTKIYNLLFNPVLR